MPVLPKLSMNGEGVVSTSPLVLFQAIFNLLQPSSERLQDGLHSHTDLITAPTPAIDVANL